MRKCKECGKRIPQRNNQVNFACQALGYCRRCYLERFPKRPMWDLPPLRQGSERLLSWSDSREMERAGFNTEVWSEDFREEMEDYWLAQMRGEVR